MDRIRCNQCKNIIDLIQANSISFCPYCGGKITFENGKTKVVEMNEENIKETEHTIEPKHMTDKEVELEKTKEIILGIIVGIGLILIFVMGIIGVT